MDLDRVTVDRLLTTTRAVRKRLDLDRPVPDDVVVECLELALQAPSAGDMQNWRWVVVTDPDKRAAIARVHRATNESMVKEMAAAADGTAARRLDSALYLIERLHEVPVHVIAYALDPGRRTGTPLPPPVLYGSVFPAVWSFQLALRTRGLGTTPLFVEDEAAMSEIVGAPPDAHLASLLPVAYYTGDTFRPAPRRPLAEVASWNDWGSLGT